MASASRDRVKQADLPLVFNGPASRSLRLRILFVHSSAADVELCVQELKRAHFTVSADVVRTPEQFAERLKSKYGSAQEFVETRILGCFLKNDEFGLGDRHALSLE
jgi:hypothetical protein